MHNAMLPLRNKCSSERSRLLPQTREAVRGSRLEALVGDGGRISRWDTGGSAALESKPRPCHNRACTCTTCATPAPFALTCSSNAIEKYSREPGHDTRISSEAHERYWLPISHRKGGLGLPVLCVDSYASSRLEHDCAGIAIPSASLSERPSERLD